MKFAAALVAVTLFCAVVSAEDAPKAEETKKAEEKTSAIPEDLAKRMDEAIKLIEDKDFTKFVEKFVPPDRLAALKQNGGSIEEAVKQLGEERPAVLAKVLKKVKNNKPVISDDGKTAKFAVTGEDLPKDIPTEVVFEKIDGVWYLQ